MGAFRRLRQRSVGFPVAMTSETIVGLLQAVVGRDMSRAPAVPSRRGHETHDRGRPLLVSRPRDSSHNSRAGHPVCHPNAQARWGPRHAGKRSRLIHSLRSRSRRGMWVDDKCHAH
jgi:hypothetical protein